MRIKTFPLQFTEDYLNEIREIAAKNGFTIKDFIQSAITEKIERLKRGEWMILTIINGSLQDFALDREDGFISVDEPDTAKAMQIAEQFFDYGFTVVIEHRKDNE